MRTDLKMLTLAVGLLFSQSIFAGVTITGTRIIFPAKQKTVTVQLNNAGEQPALIQAWLDDGDAEDIPAADKIPFILTPPLSKIEPQKGQMLRLISKGSSQLPQDRESLFWFNILDIPSYEVKSASAADENKLQVAIRSRIKLFYRPQQFKMSQATAFKALRFEYSKADQQVTINNPSPYYISFWDLHLSTAQDQVPYNDTLMLSPYSSQRIQLSKKITPQQAKYNLINDFGGLEQFTTAVESNQ